MLENLTNASSLNHLVPKVLIIGANGFVGQKLAARLQEAGVSISGCSRTHHTTSYPLYIYAGLDDEKTLMLAMKDIDIVVLLAAKTSDKGEDNALSEYRATNVKGTVNVANAAISSGVKRLIYMSTAKVNGETTLSPFNNLSSFAPTSPYGVSKMEAEIALQDICLNDKIELVILRAPLIYGAGMKGNLEAICRRLKSPLPLPFGSIKNVRSFLYIENLISLLTVSILSEKKISGVFLVSDNHDLSTTSFFNLLKQSVNGRAWLLPFPQKLLELLFFALGKKAASDKILKNLQINISSTCETFNWKPPYTPSQAMEDLKRQLEQSND